MDLTEKIKIKRHEELLSALNNISKKISLPSEKQDAANYSFFEENKEAINKLVSAIESIKIPSPQNNESTKEIIKSISDISTILVGFNKRLEQIEKLSKKPIPTKFKAVRGRYSGEIEYVTIEYSK
jgi:seryl-tRNA synthetase